MEGKVFCVETGGVGEVKYYKAEGTACAKSWWLEKVWCVLEQEAARWTGA